MAKRSTFEEILDTPFRWPKPDDRPFVLADDPTDNANVSIDGLTRLVLMMDGYKSAADLMVQVTVADPSQRDILVFPIIFNYRQFLELSIKYHLAMFGPEVGIEPNWRTHDLETLWAQFIEMLERYGTEDPDEVDPVVERTILEFAKIDPQSYSYRYPLDRKGNPLPVAYSDLHLPTLADVIQGVAGYFTGCDGYLASLRDAGP